MAKPLFESDVQNLRIRRELTPAENALRSAHFVRLNTSIGLAIAVALGLLIILVHGGHSSTAIAAYGAALGTGGVLGFLFGVPNAGKGATTNVTANRVAMGTGEHAQATTGNIAASPANSSATEPPPEINPEPELTADSNDLALPPSPPSADAAPIPTPAHTTSNLEQVADWVTKLLLGGGLTQMQRIPPTIWRWSRLIAIGIVGDNASATEQLLEAQQAFASGLLVYGFILGFFAGFLITKLELGTAIAD